MGTTEGGEPRFVIGVDLGGTKMDVGLVDSGGRTTAVERHPTKASEGSDVVLARLAERVRELSRRAEGDVHGVGVGVAGQVDPATGAVRNAPNLQWTDVPVQRSLEDAVGLPTAVLNDVQAATVGEARYGAGSEHEDLVCLFVGTGVGGGVVAGGRLVTGCGGSAGELGHITIDLHGPSCRCGNRGCLEAFVGGWAIARRVRDAITAHPRRGEQLCALVEERPDGITAGMVARAAERGDVVARELVDETAEALAAGIAAVANAFNPCLLVLGGGVVEGIPGLVERVGEEVRPRALDAALRTMRITTPALGRHAGMIGAATWARGVFREQD